MSNGPKTYTPCKKCGKPCSLGMIGSVTKWLCWDCSRWA